MPSVDQNFKLPGHNFNRHAKFILIEKLNNTELQKDILTFRLKKHEDLWKHKLKTLKPHGFNAELNFPNPSNFCIFSTIFLRRLYAEGSVTIPQRHSKEKMKSNM